MPKVGRLTTREHDQRWRPWVIGASVLFAVLQVSLGMPGRPSLAQPAPPSPGPSPSPAPDPQPQPEPGEEIVELRTETSSTFWAEDGNYEAHLYTGPINYLDEAGSWQPIDNTLVPSENPGYAYENAAGAYELLLPSELGDAPVKAQSGGHWVSLSLAGATGTVAVSENTATYAEALPGVSLAYTATGDGVKEDLTLEGPTSPGTYAFDVELSLGLGAELSPNGGVQVSDASGDVFSLAPPVAIDAAGTLAGAEEIWFELAPGPGGHLVLTITVDPTWLLSPDRAWPVVIDPTVDFNPSQDCTLDEGQPDTNLCSATILQAGAGSGGVRRRAVLQFDGLSSIPVEAQVLNADLQLWLDAKTTANTAKIELRRVTTTWYSASATWNTPDGTGSWTGGSFGTDTFGETPTVGGAEDVWVHWYPTRLVETWVNTRPGYPNQGLILKQASPENVSNLLTFHSQSGAKPPLLKVKYAQRLGEQHYYKFETFELNDRMQAKVNVHNGNLIILERDLKVAGTGGMALVVDRYYNQRSNATQDLGNRWNFSLGKDVRLTFETGGIVFHGSSGFELPFDRNTDGTYRSPDGFRGKLEVDGPGYKIKFDEDESVFRFSSSGQFSSHKDRNGNTISFAYNGDGTLQKITDTQGRFTNFDYNASGYVRLITDSGGRTYQYGYTGGELTSYTDADNRVTSFEYTNGKLTKITSPGNRVTKFSYTGEKLKDLTRVNDQIAGTGPKTSFAYTPSAKTTVVTDARLNNTTYNWDYAGRVDKVTDALTHVQSTEYDSQSNVTEFTDAETSEVFFGYDPSNNLEAVELPTGALAGWVYGDASHPHSPTQFTDPQDHVFAYEYDAAGNLKKVTSGAIVFDYHWNANGTLAWTESARNDRTLYSYFDAPQSNLRAIDYPGTRLGDVSFTYATTISRLATMTDGKGQLWSYDYDPLDRLKKITLHDGSTVRFTYDRDGNLTDRIDPAGTWHFVYDDLNRMTEKQLNASTVVTFEYDDVGNMTKLTDPGGNVTYHYDTVNNLDWMQEPGGHQTDFLYNKNNEKTKIEYPNGVDITIGRDGSGRITTIEGRDPAASLLSSYTYSYTDPVAGHDTSLRHRVTDNMTGKVTNYTFDGLNRLTKADDPATSGTIEYQYAYDGDSNMTSKVLSGTTTSYGYDPSNVLCWSLAGSSTNPCNQAPTGRTLYSFDANGSMTSSSAGFAAAYNKANQTTSITPPGGSATSFAYASATQDERVSKGTTSFVNNLLGVGSEKPSGGQPTYYRWSAPYGEPFALVSEKTPSARYYYLYDGLGSVVGLTNQSGNLVGARYTYEPYGKKLTGQTQVANPWMFAGMYFDSETQLYKTGARYYDPNLARWTQLDPEAGSLQNPVSMNRYQYAGCNPVNATDPTGRDDACLGGLIVSSLAVIVGGEILEGLAAALLVAALGGLIVAVVGTAFIILGIYVIVVTCF
jgi:RHS repeat-associated protein